MRGILLRSIGALIALLISITAAASSFTALGDLAGGSAEWQCDGTLIRYRDAFGVSDGFNVVGSVIDPERHRKVYHVWGGDCTGRAGIFQYAVSLDTPAVRQYLTEFYTRTEDA